MCGTLYRFLFRYDVWEKRGSYSPRQSSTGARTGWGTKAVRHQIEALEDLKEEREINAPSVYDERLLDSTGRYDPDLMDKEKMRIIDSIYSQGRIDYTERAYRQPKPDPVAASKPTQKDTVSKSEKEKAKELVVATKEMGLEHQLFFASDPKENPTTNSHNTDALIFVRVDGTQTVKNDFRLQMRLSKAATIYGRHFPRNTAIYGFVSLSPIGR